MILNISNRSGIIERGVYSFGLSDYPNISPLEMKNLVAFLNYEKSHGRQTEIVCEDKNVIATVNHAVAHPEIAESYIFPEIIEGDCACNQKGCLTRFVCHSTDIKATKSILSSGKLLSAVKVYGKTGDELAYEKRDSLWNDPADFFEYIMFNWGNCIFGEYVVMSSHIDNPSEEHFENSINPGVRFYFSYEDILRHPGHTYDGYHIVKVKDEIVLSKYLHACIIPEQNKTEMVGFILPELAPRVYYIPHNVLSLRDWSEQIYDFISKL